MGSSSVSQSSNPIADNKPTLSDSPTDIFNNQVKSFSGSRVAESLYGDTAAQDLNKATSQFGAALNRSNQTITLSGGSSITDGGAIMAMFSLASKAIEGNSLTNLVQTMQGGGVNTATSAASQAATNITDTVKDFFSQHKGAVIAGGLVLAFLIYKGFSK